MSRLEDIAPADADELEQFLVLADLQYLQFKQSGELQRREAERNMRAQIQENFRSERQFFEG
jgi:hypothetical protein